MEVVNKRVKVAGGFLQTQLILPKDKAVTGPWLVFLHEALGSIRLWRQVPGQLAASTQLPVLVYERHGHGNSDPFLKKRDVAFLHHEAQVVLPELLDCLGIETSVLIGHSDGGSIALLFASQFPHRTCGVISEAAHVFVEPETLQGIQQAGDVFYVTSWREKLAKYHGDKTDGVFQAWQDIWLSQAFKSWNIEAALASIRAPVLVIQGADDAYGTKAQVDAIVGKVTAETTQLWVPNCGHEPHREAADIVLPAMTDFIKKLKS